MAIFSVIAALSSSLQVAKILQGGSLLLEGSPYPLFIASDKVVVTVVLNEIYLNTTYEKFMLKLNEIKNVTPNS